MIWILPFSILLLTVLWSIYIADYHTDSGRVVTSFTWGMFCMLALWIAVLASCTSVSAVRKNTDLGNKLSCVICDESFDLRYFHDQYIYDSSDGPFDFWILDDPYLYDGNNVIDLRAEVVTERYDIHNQDGP